MEDMLLIFDECVKKYYILEIPTVIHSYGKCGGKHIGHMQRKSTFFLKDATVCFLPTMYYQDANFRKLSIVSYTKYDSDFILSNLEERPFK